MGQSLCLLSSYSIDTQNTDETSENKQRHNREVLIMFLDLCSKTSAAQVLDVQFNR